MKYSSLILLSVFTTLSSIGQTQIKNNSIYIELGGNALFTSINYERKLFNNLNFTAHFGTGVYGIKPTYLTIPFGVKYHFNLKGWTDFVDIGFGATYSRADVKLYKTIDRKNPNFKQTNFWNFIPNLGYKKVTKNNIMYRISLTPVFNHNDMIPFIGLSFGKYF